MEPVSLEQENERLKEELEKAREEADHLRRQVRSAVNLRYHLMPDVFPVFSDTPSVDIYADQITMARVGGDFFDIFRIDADHIGILIADIFDGGDAASLFMVAFKVYLSGELSMGFSPKKLMKITNNRLSRYNADNLCLSAWYGIYEISTGKVTAVNAGHEPPIIAGKNGAAEISEDRQSYLMGVIEGISYIEYEFVVEPGETLFLYTDGVTRVNNKEGALYTTEQMEKVLESCRDESAEDTVAKLQEDLAAFGEGEPFADDITLLCLKRKGGNEE